MTTMTLHKKRLGTYLNDHLAGSTAGIELAKRTTGNNEGTPYGDFLASVLVEVEEDRDTLKDIMKRLDIDQNALKVSMGWAAEKLGRLKLNDQLIGYSPLSRLIELEGLMLGVSGKRALWQALQPVLDGHPALTGISFDALVARAEGQIHGLEHHRRQAAIEALTESAPED
jgi:hypothetical protein